MQATYARRPIAAAGKAATAFKRAVLGLAGGVGSGVALVAASSGLGSPLLMLGVPFGLALGVWLLLSPSVAFLLTAFIIPIERLGRFTADNAALTISLMRIVGTVALGAFLLQALVMKKRIVFGGAFWLYSFYLLLAILGVFHTTHELGTVRAISAILGNLLFFMLVINVARSAQLVKWSVAIWLISTVLIGLFTVYTWHFGQSVSEADLGEMSSRFSTVMADTSEWEELDTVARASGPTSHSAVYAINLILTLPFFFYFRKGARTLVANGIITFGLLVTLYNIFLTNTRAAILLAAAVVAFCGLRGLWRITAGGVIAGMLAIVAMLPLVPDAIWNRVLDPTNYSTQRSATLRIRFEYWSAGIDIAGENWLTGIGVGNQMEIPKRLKDVGPEETTVHNEYIMTAMEVGLPGWLTFFGFVGLMFAAALRAGRLSTLMPPGTAPPRDFFVAAQVAMLSTLVYGLQVDVFHFPLKGWWLVAGLCWAMYREMAETLPRVNSGFAPTQILAPGDEHASSIAHDHPARA